MNQAVTEVEIDKYADGNITTAADILAIEEPLEMKLVHGKSQERQITNVSITMRTPGNDLELTIGFLFTEGIITHINQLQPEKFNGKYSMPNVIQIECDENLEIDKKLLQRNFYTTSACGVCGKASIDAIFSLTGAPKKKNDFIIAAATVIRLPELLSAHQEIFKHTGGIHAAALFSKDGLLLKMREDVGRHNALDKLIGSYLLKSTDHNIIPEGSILLLSGRASFELIQKSAMAGISVISAVGAPSSLAVETAKRFGITLIGFSRHNRFNIYSNPHRIQL